MSGRIVAAIGLLTLVASVTGVGGGLPVQPEQPEQPEIASQEASETVDDTSGQPVDGQVTLTDWQYDQGTFTLEFRTNVPREVVITEAVNTESAGSGDLAIKKITLSRGNSTVQITVGAPDGNAGVTITTTEGANQGRAAFVSAGGVSGSGSSPLAGSSATMGWIGGALLALLAVVGAGWYRMRSEAKAPEVAG